MISVLTEEMDLSLDEMREAYALGYDNPNDPEFKKVFPDLYRKYVSQTTFMWKHPESGEYFYLIRDEMFYMYKTFTTDRSTYPPTINEMSVFDYCENQETFRDVLLSRPPAVQITFF